MKKYFILFLIISISLISFTACNSKSEDVKDNESEVTEKLITGAEKLPIEKLEVDDEQLSYLGKWQTEDGAFTYELFEDGKLYVGSQYGIDENCSWTESEDNVLTFSYSDEMGMVYKYNVEKDILEDINDTSFYLVRVTN